MIPESTDINNSLTTNISQEAPNFGLCSPSICKEEKYVICREDELCCML